MNQNKSSPKSSRSHILATTAIIIISLVLISLLFGIYTIFSLVTYSKPPVDNAYKQDVNLIENVASTLGLSTDDLIGLDRHYEHSIETSMDTLQLLYSTDLTLEDFMIKTKSVPYLIHKNYGNPGYDIPLETCDFLQDVQLSSVKVALGNKIGTSYASGKYIIQTDNGETMGFTKGICPKTLFWSGILPAVKGRWVTVTFAQPNAIGERWTANGKIVKQNLVLIIFDRQNHH